MPLVKCCRRMPRGLDLRGGQGRWRLETGDGGSNPVSKKAESLRSARSDSKARKVPPEFANGGNKAHGDARIGVHPGNVG